MCCGTESQALHSHSFWLDSTFFPIIPHATHLAQRLPPCPAGGTPDGTSQQVDLLICHPGRAARCSFAYRCLLQCRGRTPPHTHVPPLPALLQDDRKGPLQPSLSLTPFHSLPPSFCGPFHSLSQRGRSQHQIASYCQFQ